MSTVPLVDLKAAYARHLEAIDAAMRGVIENTRFIQGKEVAAVIAETMYQAADARDASVVPNAVTPEHFEDLRRHWNDGEIVEILADRALERAQRVVAVGTTAVRTIETAARTGAKEGETDLFLYPGCEFRRVGAMLTNFHLPCTSLLLLVCAFAGTETMRRAYAEAIERGYRFYSYGDGCLLLR